MKLLKQVNPGQYRRTAPIISRSAFGDAMLQIAQLVKATSVSKWRSPSSADGTHVQQGSSTGRLAIARRLRASLAAFYADMGERMPTSSSSIASSGARGHGKRQPRHRSGHEQRDDDHGWREGRQSLRQVASRRAPLRKPRPAVTTDFASVQRAGDETQRHRHEHDLRDSGPRARWATRVTRSLPSGGRSGPNSAAGSESRAGRCL